MVDEQIEAREIVDPRVLAAMRQVPRHEFVPAAERAHAYEDRPLPIGEGQTISQPYIVALMTQLAGVGRGARVLEVGTGSGYQAAVLAACGAEVYSIEIVDALAKRAQQDLARLGIENVHVRSGDGYRGWPEAAPFDAMVITAAVPEIPDELLKQLKPGGRAVLPVGPPLGIQDLVLIEKGAGGKAVTRTIFPVRFVPATGRQ